MFFTIFSEDIVVYCLRVDTLSCFLLSLLGNKREKFQDVEMFLYEGF